MSKFEQLNAELMERFFATGQMPTDEELNQLRDLAVSEATEDLDNLVDEVAAHLGHGDDRDELITSIAPRIVSFDTAMIAVVAILRLAELKVNSGSLETV